MMNEFHFNALTPSEDERLAILAEECAEVIKEICKIQRHGYESTNPNESSGETNREALERELGDLFHAANRLMDCMDISRRVVEERRDSKPERIKPYLHHQEAV